MQWNKNDNAANSVNWAVQGFRKSADSTNTALLFGNTTADIIQTGAVVGQFGVSAGEQTASRANTGGARAAHAGWVLRKVGTGGRAGRVQMETLVAMKSITGDAEDTILPDWVLSITTQPTDSSETTGDPTSFTVVAQSSPPGATLVYTWQVDGGNGTWAAISDGGVYANSDTATLDISDNTGLDGNVYRVIVQASGAANVVSQNASITEV